MLETVLYQYRGPYSNSSFPISDEKDFYHSGKGALQFSLLNSMHNSEDRTGQPKCPHTTLLRLHTPHTTIYQVQHN